MPTATSMIGGDQRGVLVRELCAVHNLLPLFQRFWTLAWQSPTGATWKKKVDFCFSNQESAKVEIAENLHSRSDHKPLRLTRPHVQGVMLEFERKKKSLAGWFPQTSSQHHELHSALRKHVSLGASVWGNAACFGDRDGGRVQGVGMLHFRTSD